MTIQELEARLERGLAELRSPEYKTLEALLGPIITTEYRVRVSLVDQEDKHGKKRKKRKNASANNWSPATGEVRIYFEKDTVNSAVAKDDVSSESHTKNSDEFEPIPNLVRALDRAESKPGYQFISLKWFRDVALPAESLDWARSDSVRQNILREAIERRLILTSKVPNPKSPQFPVTAIRLNRLLPEIQAILGEQVAHSDFRPVDIRGEGLSATVLRERR